MSDQISHDDPIWALTPTELLIAYWSLTLKKPEIADKASIGEGTVGTHLTSIYTKLGLSELDDEVKRSLLVSRHGQSLNSVVKEIDEEFFKYEDKTKALQKKKSEIVKRKRKAELPPAEASMQSPPPLPQAQPQTQLEARRGGVPRIVWFIGGFLVLFGVCGFFGLNFLRGLFNQVATFTPQPNTQVVISATETSSAVTQNPTQTPLGSPTPEASQTPEETATPVITPTAVPLPVRENFSQQYSDLWRVTGEPFLTSGDGVNPFDGVLTVKPGETATLWIGNSGWTSYLIRTRLGAPGKDPSFVIGVRVKDLNNMITFGCSPCQWTVVKDGLSDVLVKGQTLDTEGELTISVDGDSFTATGVFTTGYPPVTVSVILPPKYQGVFPNGGVILKINDEAEVDYIEIDPLK